MNLGLLKPVWHFTKKNATKILAGGAVISEWIGLYFMHKEAPIVKQKLDALPPDAKNWDKFKTAFPVYIPAFLMMIVSTGCIVGGVAYGEHQQALLASLCSASEAALVAQQKKIVEQLGPEKAAEIEDAIAKDLIKQNPPTQTNVIATGKGDQLFYEPLSGRYFTSSWNEVEKAVNKFNSMVIRDVWGSVNEWYDCLDLDHVGLADDRAWNVDHQLKIGRTPIATDDDRTCWMICYDTRPVLYK